MFLRTVRACVIAGAVAGLALLSVGGQASAQEGGQFRFRVCNHSGASASVAIGYYVQRRTVLQGWWNVAPHGCQVIGSYPQGRIYYYAGANRWRTQWKGNLNYCVSMHKFRQFNRPGAPCVRGQRPVGFTTHIVRSSEYTWNLNGPGGGRRHYDDRRDDRDHRRDDGYYRHRHHDDDHGDY